MYLSFDSFAAGLMCAFFRIVDAKIRCRKPRQFYSLLSWQSVLLASHRCGHVGFKNDAKRGWDRPPPLPRRPS